MDGEDENNDDTDTIAPLCTCSFSYNATTATLGATSRKTPGSTSFTPTATTTWLESSFVHLLTPRRAPLLSISSPSSSRSSHHHHNSNNKQLYYHHSPHGFLEQQQLLEQLLKAATTTSSGSESSSAEISLCTDCINRVAAALDTETQRLYMEVKAYRDAVSEARLRAKTTEASITIYSKVAANLPEAEAAYADEIMILRQEVEAREAELAHLNYLLKEQIEITNDLDSFADHLHKDQNTLELQSKSFDDSAKLLSKTLAKVQTEVDQLSIVRLPLSLFDLQVDERGLRYPLINQLRLAFRPKGDATDAEIRAAWSQATQLLLILGTLLQYPSSEWKLVPLADCAKLIYRKEIFNLKPGDCRSLMALNALLDQVIRHAKTIFAAQQQEQQLEIKSPPFPSSPSSIGNTELARLDRTDHVGWSHVIHRMASNLLWLSERTSELCKLQVSTLTHSVV